MINKNNFGYIKNGLIKKATSLYLNENKMDGDLKEFLNVVKSSPILSLEFIVYKNLENKHISDDILATRYIDENISILNKYTKKEILEENKKLEKFFNEQKENEKSNLYESINTLILENSKNNKFKNIDKIHSSFENILNHIKNNDKNLINENKSIFDEYKDKYLNVDFIFNKAVDKFNKKYSHLSEGEKRLLKVLIHNNIEEQKNIFENIINETKNKINKLLIKEEDPIVSNKLYKTKEKLSEMCYNEKTLIDDFVKLNSLKESL